MIRRFCRAYLILRTVLQVLAKNSPLEVDFFRISIFCCFVALSSSGVLLVKATESNNGKLEYNTASAVFCIEFFKLIFAFINVKREEKTGSNVDANGSPIFSGESKISFRGWCLYGIPSLLYALLNNLNIHAAYHLGPHIFALFSNLKILTAALFSAFILKKRINRVQWISLVLLICALSVAKIKVLQEITIGASAGHKTDSDISHTEDSEKTDGPDFRLGFLFVSITASLSGFSGVVNEFLLKRADPGLSLMQKSLWTYQWGCILNLLGALFTSSTRKSNDYDADNENDGLFHGFSLPVWLLICVNAGMGVSVSFILKYFDTIVKGFASCASVFIVAFGSCTLFGSQIDASFGLALLIFACSSYLYVGPHNAAIDEFENGLLLGVVTNTGGGSGYVKVETGSNDESDGDETPTIVINNRGKNQSDTDVEMEGDEQNDSEMQADGNNIL